MRRRRPDDSALPRDLKTMLWPAIALTGLTGGVLYLIGSLPHGAVQSVLIMVLAGTIALLAIWSMKSINEHAERAFWVSDRREEAVPPAALDYRLLRIRRDLRDAVERDDRPDHVYPVIRDLTAERLQANHDIDLDAEPERAKAVMTPALWRYLTHPPEDTRKRSRNSLHTAIDGIEDL